VDYKASINTSPESRAQFVAWLSNQTVNALQVAQNDPEALASAVKDFVAHAITAELSQAEIEDILGVNEPCIMDNAGLSEADEDTVIDTFESLFNE
jgi:hypothetical protein